MVEETGAVGSVEVESEVAVGEGEACCNPVP